MSEPTIPVSEPALAQLRELSQWSGKPISEELEQAIKAHYDRQFWAVVNAGYAALRGDSQAWAEEQAERRLWERTLLDGLDPAERWGEDGAPLPSAGEEGPR